MRNDVLIRHFLTQFVESDSSPESDRHQVLAIAAAALITIPLFVTVFMSVKYLMRPLQASGWTETAAMGDEVTFCAASMLVSAAVALLEWDALALTPRDAVILGVLPVPHRAVVQAKLAALVLFASCFAVALNAIPALLHPVFMTAQLPMSVVWLLPLTAAHAFATVTAAVFGFCAVLSIREAVYLVVGPHRFHLIANRVRSLLLLGVLLLLALVPVRLSDSAAWMFERARGSVLLEPVRWFAAEHAATAGRMLDALPRPDQPPRMAAEEARLTNRYREALPRFTAAGLQGLAAAATSIACAIGLYLWNARRMHLLVEAPPVRRPRHVPARVRTFDHPARRAGRLFTIRALLRSTVHHLYMIVAVVAGVALFITIGTGAIGTMTLAAQTLLVAAVLWGFRAAIRTAADERAAWTFDVAEAAGDRFRGGVRLVGLALVGATVALVLPFDAVQWGWTAALAHAVDGAAVGWLLVEAAMADVDRPLVVSLPPSDGMNTVGVVLGGAAVIVIFIAAHIELYTLTTITGCILFPLSFALMAVAVRRGRT